MAKVGPCGFSDISLQKIELFLLASIQLIVTIIIPSFQSAYLLSHFINVSNNPIRVI